MTTPQAFRMTFLIAALMTAAEMLLPSNGTIATSLAGYAVLTVFGFFGGRAGETYGRVFSLTWPFVALWFGAGVLNYLLGLGDIPEDWTPQQDRQAFYGYTLATVMFLPVAFACSGVGLWIARLTSKRASDPNEA
jgi:hypothetical protein